MKNQERSERAKVEGTAMLGKLACAIFGALALSACKTTPNTPDVASAQVIPGGTTLWMVETVPNVGDLVSVRLITDASGKVSSPSLMRGSIFYPKIAGPIAPVKGTGYDQDIKITGSSGIIGAVSLLKGLAPSASVDLSRSRNVVLKTTGGSSLTLPDRTSYLTALQAKDAGPKASTAERNAFGTLNAASTTSQYDPSGKVGTLFLVVAVQTAETLTYTSDASANASLGGKATSAAIGSGSLDLSNKSFTQQGVTAKGAPILVRLKRIGRDASDGAIRYDENSDGPAVIIRG